MRYRKKPIIIEAEEYKGYGTPPKGVCKCAQYFNKAHVHTIHSQQLVVIEAGDFIIAEPDGEHFYPCKAEIFDNTYERMAE